LGEVEREISLAFRRRFIGEVEHVIVEEPRGSGGPPSARHRILHGRADRYFEIHFEADNARAGDLVSVRIDRVTPTRTHGTLLRPYAEMPSPHESPGAQVGLCPTTISED
jgi:tRNA A37 methylthiotransferase MiaB